MFMSSHGRGHTRVLRCTNSDERAEMNKPEEVPPHRTPSALHSVVTALSVVTYHLLDVGGTCYTDHTPNQFKTSLGLDHQLAIRLARRLHAQSVMYANKLVTSRHAIEKKNTSHSQVLEPGGSGAGCFQ
eukprot:1142830-Pelagomonas_calceolata.AAC.2